MRKLLVLLALLASWSYVHGASYVARDQKGNSATISTDQPCASPKMVEVHVSKGFGAVLRGAMSASMTLDGKVLEACWLPHEDHVDVLNEKGDVYHIPIPFFEPVTGA